MIKHVTVLVAVAAALTAVLSACGVLPDLGGSGGEVRCMRSEPDGGCTTHLLCNASSCPEGETAVDGGGAGCFNQIGECLQ